MKNILITGGAGFIGSNLALKLVQKGYFVTILDNLSPQIHGDDPIVTSSLYQSIINQPNIHFILGTVSERRDWEIALKNQDAIIHLAAETGTGQSMYKIQHYVDVNMNGTALMLDILANEKHHIQKMIIASSRAIYGEGKYNCNSCGVVYPNSRLLKDLTNGDFECKCPICHSEVSLKETCEMSKIHPSSVYGITKQNQEQMVLTVGESINVPSVAFRYQNVYGPGQSLTNPYTGILSIFSSLMRTGKDVFIFEDGKESRDFVYIDDVVNATILGLEKDESNYQTYNVGTGVAVDVYSVAQILQSNYGTNSNISINGNFRIGDIRHNYADLSKITKELGFAPSVSFESGIQKFCNWVNTQEIVGDKYEASINEMKLKGIYK